MLPKKECSRKKIVVFLFCIFMSYENVLLTTANHSVDNPVCDRGVIKNVIFLVDSTFNNITPQLRTLVTWVIKTAQDTRRIPSVSFITFDKRPEVLFDFSVTVDEQPTFDLKISNHARTPPLFMGRALRFLKRRIINSTTYRNNSSAAIVIVIVGKRFIHTGRDTALLLRQHGIKMVAVGHGSFVEDQLDTLTSSENVVMIKKSKDFFPKIKLVLESLLCISLIEENSNYPKTNVKKSITPTLEAKRHNTSSVTLTWFVNYKENYNHFEVVAVSALGRHKISVSSQPSQRIGDNSTNVHIITLDKLYPCSRYLVILKFGKHHVQTEVPQCKLEGPSISLVERYLILSADDGVYSLSLQSLFLRGNGTIDDDLNRLTAVPKKIFAVIGGVVNAVPRMHISKAHGTLKNSIIWIERKTRHIKMTFLSHNKENITLVTGLLQPVALAVDSYDSNVFWSDISDRSIGVASLHNNAISNTTQKVVRRLITRKLFTPIALTVDPIERILFWADYWGRIERSNLQGGDRKVVVDNPMQRLHSLHFCVTSNRLYWIDLHSSAIRSLRPDGTDVHTIAVTSSQMEVIPTHMAISRGVYYLLNTENRFLYSIPQLNISTHNMFDQPTLFANMDDVKGITAIATLDTQVYEQVLVSKWNNLTFPCSTTSNNTCGEVCLSLTIKSATCVSQCLPWEVLCSITESTCINTLLLCDGFEDCPNGEDEKLPECQFLLNQTCDSHLFQCSNKQCITEIARCDGRKDCRDGSDEEDCVMQSQSCSFENDFCLWSQAIDDDFDWNLWHGRTPSSKTGPNQDHTMLHSNSSYIYIEATSEDENSKARLVSTFFVRPVCIRFNYHMYGDGMGTLSLIMKKHTHEDEKTLWNQTENTGVFWKEAVVSVKQHGMYNLIFEAQRGRNYRSDIAIDDVEIIDGLCNISYVCQFGEENHCGYENISGRTKVGWSVVAGSIETRNINHSTVSKFVMTTAEPLNEYPLKDLGPEWFYFPFDYDDTPGCSGCHGTRLVRQISSFGSPQFAGLVLCSTTRYKIYLSDTLRTKFKNIADGDGTGEDHCEFVGDNGFALEVGDYVHCGGANAFRRRRFLEPVHEGPFGLHQIGMHKYLSPSYYRCNLNISQQVIANDPYLPVTTKRNYMLLFDDKTQPNISRSFYIPVRGGKNISSIKEQISMDRWCLSFSYYISGLGGKLFRVSLDKKVNIWEEDDLIDMWNEAWISIPSNKAKFDIVFTVSKSTEVGFVAVDNVTIHNFPCRRKISYSTQFDEPSMDRNPFFISGDVETVQFRPMYQRESYEPVIVFSLPHATNAITSTIDRSRFNIPPVIESPVLPAISSYYPVYCLSVEYRQKANQGRLNIGIRRVNEFEVEDVKFYELTQIGSVRPWLTLRVEINSSMPLANNSSFVFVLHGLELVWINSMVIDTQSCSHDGNLKKCDNAVKCFNGKCASVEQLCDGINDCGDWSDEKGCPSYCDSEADVFHTNAVLMQQNAVNISSVGRHCFWRIHGTPGKLIVLTTSSSIFPKEKFTDIDKNTRRSLYKTELHRLTVGEHVEKQPLLHMLTVHKGFSSTADALLFEENSTIFLKTSFTHSSSYVFNEQNITIVVVFPNQNTRPAFTLNVSLSDPQYCSFTCPDHSCLTDNYRCDGKIGCSDASDEINCTRAVELLGETFLEVRRLEGRFSLLCGDDISHQVADTACQQLGFARAFKPLRFTTTPKKFSLFPHYRIRKNFTDEDPQYIQGILANSDASNPENIFSGGCPSGSVWVANCEPYTCGIRSVHPSVRQSTLKIVGGPMSQRGQWPWIASLQAGGEHLCGGTLISDRFVVTAAHCFDLQRASKFVVVLGTNDLDQLDDGSLVLSIKNSTIHEKYDEHSEIPDWDIALVELNQPVKFTKYISPICLPAGSIRFGVGKKCYIAGYGHRIDHTNEALHLFHAETPILNQSQCNEYYKTLITSRMMCTGYPKTGGIGICHGDSGGPLVCADDNNQWYLSGIISWSIGCAKVERPDVFANVQFFIEWINQHTRMKLALPAHVRSGFCGGTFYGQRSGFMASPGWPSEYLSNQECIYRILIEPGQTIHIQFDTIVLEKDYDFITIYKQGISNRNVFVRLTGEIGQVYYEVENSSLDIVFVSDDGVQKAGFIANWTVTGKQVNFTDDVKPKFSTHIILLTEDPSIQFVNGNYSYTRTDTLRPSYIQLPQEKTNLSSLYSLFFYQPLGQWWIQPTESDESSVFRLYANDSSVMPSSVMAVWNFWNGSTWNTVNIAITEMTSPVFNHTTPTQHTLQPATTISTFSQPSSCYHILNNLTGSITFMGLYKSGCVWRILPDRGMIENGTAIVLLVEVYDSEYPLNIYEGMADLLRPPLAVVWREHEGIFASGEGSGQSPASKNLSSWSGSTPILSGTAIKLIATEIAANPLCFKSFQRFLSYTCTSEVYAAFQTRETAGVTALLNCELFIRCIKVDWCALAHILSSLPSSFLPGFVSNKVCEDPTWRPEPNSIKTTIPFTGQGSYSRPTSVAVSMSQKRVIVFYDITHDGLTLILNSSAHFSPLHFTMKYEVAKRWNQTATFSLNGLDVHHIRKSIQVLVHRKKRAINHNLNSVVKSTIHGFNSHPSLTTASSPTSTGFFQTLLTKNHQSNVNNHVTLNKTLDMGCANTSWKSGEHWYVTSPNFPQAYLYNSRCLWSFQTLPGYQIVVEFSEFQVERDSTCKFDGVVIYDGADRNAVRIGTFCDASDNFITPKISKGHSLTIEFYSDHIVNRKGFKARLSVRAVSMSSQENAVKPLLFFCDFLNDKCDFTDDVLSSDFTWTWNRSNTPSDRTGPPGDDSPLQAGGYAYIEASAPQTQGDIARIVSPVIRGNPDSAVCLRFSYDMYGSAQGLLNVYARVLLKQRHSEVILEADGTESVLSTKPLVHLYGSGLSNQEQGAIQSNVTKIFLIWSKSGEQRKFDSEPWIKTAVTFFPFNDFQIIFEGVRGRMYESDTAIDNVAVFSGHCHDKCTKEEGFFQCVDKNGFPLEGVCVPVERKCDGILDCPAGSDESDCYGTYQRLCQQAKPGNDRVALVCSNIHKCLLINRPITFIEDILCDGIIDCFGGYDESFCGNTSANTSTQEQTEALLDTCGKPVEQEYLNVTTNYPTVANPNMWPWVLGLYVVRPDLVKPMNELGNVEHSGFTFLCTTVLVDQYWAVVPAHCILNTRLYHRYVTDIWNEGKNSPSEEILVEFDDLPKEPEIHLDFSYQLFSPHNPKSEFRKTWEVLRYFIHPKYDVNVAERLKNNSAWEEDSFGRYDDQRYWHGIFSDDTRQANYDIALLRIVEKSNSLETAEIEGGDENGLEGDAFYTVYDSNPSWNKTSEKTAVPCCLPAGSKRERFHESLSQNNMFQLSHELQRYQYSMSKKDDTAIRSTCVVVGHSPVHTLENQHLTRGIRAIDVPVTSSDLSAPVLFCNSYVNRSARKLCLQRFSENEDALSHTKPKLNELTRSGFGSIKTGSFLNDPGLSLFCKRYDDRWFLAGLFSWINFKQKKMFPNFSDIVENIHNSLLLSVTSPVWPNHNPTLGIPLGTDYFMQISNDVSSWIDRTLRDSCPGEFSCERSNLSKSFQCIPKSQVCDGKIDCSSSAADELNCLSGCSYQRNLDPFAVYYERLLDAGVVLPTGAYNKLSSNYSNSYILGNKEFQRVMFNKVEQHLHTSCKWIIVPSKNEVAVVRIPKTNVNFINGNGNIKILINDNIITHDWRKGPSSYMSQPGQPITYVLPVGRKTLQGIRAGYFEYYSEEPGLCSGMHRCLCGKCVSLHKLCDGSFDCSDMSDEHDCPSGCGGQSLLTKQEGIVTSRHYPAGHNGSGDCIWLIAPILINETGNFAIMLEFSHFMTSHRDKLFIYEGIGSDKTLLDVYYGDRGNFTVTIPSTKATLLLRSNDEIHRRRIRGIFYGTFDEEKPV